MSVRIILFTTTILASAVIFLGCASSKSKRIEDPWSDDATVNMRHGWTVFSGPKRTLIGVNDEDSIASGKRLYMQHCSQCHGTTGKGDGPLAKEKGIKPASLFSMSGLFPNHYLVVQINDGRGDMPAWKEYFEPQAAWDLTNYIQVLGKSYGQDKIK